MNIDELRKRDIDDIIWVNTNAHDDIREHLSITNTTLIFQSAGYTSWMR